jgi:hypothetical protein
LGRTFGNDQRSSVVFVAAEALEEGEVRERRRVHVKAGCLRTGPVLHAVEEGCLSMCGVTSSKDTLARRGLFELIGVGLNQLALYDVEHTACTTVIMRPKTRPSRPSDQPHVVERCGDETERTGNCEVTDIAGHRSLGPSQS